MGSRDLPPGCSISDIPGNRSEDMAWDILMEEIGESDMTAFEARARWASQPDLLAAAIRMMVGITKEDTPTCDWYEGIEWDAVDEARAAIAKAKP